jgi:HlyD family secretion protein
MAILALALTLTAAGVVSWQKLRRSESSLSQTEVTEVRPELRELSTTVTATGIVRLPTGAEVRVGTQISGIVTQLAVTVGAHIDKGGVIALIDSRGLNARIDQARSQIKIDEAILEKTDRDLRRSRALSEAGLIARQQTEDLEQDLNSAKARLEKSQSDLRVVESDLPYLVIRAPITGTVSQVSTQQGETVAASFSAPNFVTLIEDKALEVVAMVDETDIANVRPSDSVVFTTETYPAREFQGIVERVAPKATIISGVVNYEVGISIRSGIAMLKPDMTTNVNIQTAKRRALVIPTAAVHKGRADPFVYIAAGGVPKKIGITIGQRDRSWTEVKRGLTEGDRVLLGYFEANQPKEGG